MYIVSQCNSVESDLGQWVEHQIKTQYPCYLFSSVELG